MAAAMGRRAEKEVEKYIQFELKLISRELWVYIERLIKKQ